MFSSKEEGFRILPVSNVYYCYSVSSSRDSHSNVLFSSSNTFRIFDETLPDHLDPADVYQNYKYPTRDPEEYELLKSHNTPHPLNAKFIRTNVRFLNEPIAYMETSHTMEEQCHRLLTRGVGGVRHIPESSGAAVPLGRDRKPTELRENRCEREKEREKEKERERLSVQ